MRLTKTEINELLARGATLGPAVQLPREEPQPEEPREVKLVDPDISIANGKLKIMVAFATKSEANLRSWKGRSRRSGEAWRAVREAIGYGLSFLEELAQAYDSGTALRVTFTRLGGRKMDRSNLPAAMKGVEDAVAYLLEADDGSPAWHPFFEQEPGGEVGVRIEVEIYQ